MKKILLSAIALICVFASFSQDKKSYKNLVNRAGDHLMVQLSTDFWSGTPDSVKNHMKSIGRGGNIYAMMNKPFKSNPSFSIAFGVGIGTSSMYFKRMDVGITSTSAKLPFVNLDSADRFKKYKLTTAFLEVPLEFRYSSDPENDRKSIKAAFGVKVGTMLNAHTKGKTLENKDGKQLNSYTEKENSKKFFNSTRLAITARVGYGNFSLFGSYQMNNLFKDGVAAQIKPFQIGLCLSGL
ncbi:MAG: outer membrane beta-barrel protein [Chitinophagaceae bacterium]|nr:outer membrane beta-barrel protein [Chitinophagaceae bacterium]